MPSRTMRCDGIKNMLRRLRQQFNPIIGLLLCVGLAGCTGSVLLPSPRSLPQVTPTQQDNIGAAVEKRLLQMLGGPYHEQRLLTDLQLLARPAGLRLAVADRSETEIYALPGQRAIVTRGLIAVLPSPQVFVRLMKETAVRSGRIYSEQADRALVETTRDFLAGNRTPRDPDAADLRLARLFAQRPCAGNCLAIPAAPTAGQETLWPQSVLRLQALDEGYRLLQRAHALEAQDQTTEAIALYLKAATVAVDEPRILSALGMAYLRAGRLQPARMHLGKAVDLQPDYYRTQMGLGYLYLQMNKIRLASRALAESVRLLPVPENLFLLAEACEKDGDRDNALDLYRLVADAEQAGDLGQTALQRLQQGRRKP